MTAGDSPVVAPVLIIGAGKVGLAAATALRRKGVEVHVIDRSAPALEPMREAGAVLFPGDAADRQLLERAGIHTVSVVRPPTTRHEHYWRCSAGEPRLRRPHHVELVVIGEGVELFTIPVPPSLSGRRLGASGIGSATGLSVVAVDRTGTLVTTLTAETPLDAGATLVMLGSLEQRRAFADHYEGGRRAD